MLHRLIPQFWGLTDDSVVSPRFTKSGLYSSQENGLGVALLDRRRSGTRGRASTAKAGAVPSARSKPVCGRHEVAWGEVCRTPGTRPPLPPEISKPREGRHTAARRRSGIYVAPTGASGLGEAPFPGVRRLTPGYLMPPYGLRSRCQTGSSLRCGCPAPGLPPSPSQTSRIHIHLGILMQR